MSSYCVRFAATGLPGKSPPDFTCPFPLRGMGSEQCEMERGIHLFLAHPHLGGWVASGARRKGASIFFLPTPTQGVGGERSETEGGISAMVNDGGCPFMFDGTLSFDRVLMPASQASTALRQPPSTTSWSPSHRERGEARVWERGSPHRPASLSKARV